MPFLRKALRLLGVRARDHEDLLQDIFLAAHRGFHRFVGWRHVPVPDGDQPAARFRALRPRTTWDPICAWLFGIAWRLVRHHAERAYRRHEVPAGLHAGPILARGQRDERPDPEQAAIGKQSLDVLAAVLTGIDLQRRAILVLHDALEVPITVIARELGLVRTTAQNRLHLAREDVRAAARRLGAELWTALHARGGPPPPPPPRPAAQRRRRGARRLDAAMG